MMKTTALRIIIFYIILLFILSNVSHVLCFKYSEGITQIRTFYQLEDNTVDVLILGSSHAFVNINNGTLWDEYGIASYTLGGAVQPMWNSYYCLKEALKTQTPALIILEGYDLALDYEYLDDTKTIMNTYGLKWSLDKVAAIKESVPKDRRSDFFLTYGQYHSRYRNLNRGDFLWYDDIQVDTSGKPYFRKYKGQYLFCESNPQIQPTAEIVLEKADIMEKEEKFYRMILDLAREREIPVLVTIVPYVSIDRTAQQRFNKATDIAKEYEADFLNCSLYVQEIGMDFNTDYRDTEHMNCDGSRRFSSYLGKYIKSHYTVCDRRGDLKYESWQENADYTRQYLHASKLLQIKELEKLSVALADSNYKVFIAVESQSAASNPSINSFLNELGIKNAESGIWLKEANRIAWQSGEGEALLYTREKMHDICLRRDYVCDIYVNQIIIDNWPRKVVDDGVNIVVYDEKLETVIDRIGINAIDNSVVHFGELDVF